MKNKKYINCTAIEKDFYLNDTPFRISEANPVESLLSKVDEKQKIH